MSDITAAICARGSSGLLEFRGVQSPAVAGCPLLTANCRCRAGHRLFF